MPPSLTKIVKTKGARREIFDGRIAGLYISAHEDRGSTPGHECETSTIRRRRRQRHRGNDRRRAVQRRQEVRCPRSKRTGTGRATSLGSWTGHAPDAIRAAGGG